ncbi:MAG: phage holin family protein [Pseudorhodoplanes sp.]|nr:phage holin family protein [Pseudorhodoplanes sp.]
MSLVQYAAARVGRAASRVAKLAGGYLAAGVLLLVGIGYASTAAVMALETAIGPAGARFVLAAFYMLCGAAIIVAMRWRENPSAAASESEQSAGDKPRALNLAMLLEALMLGFSMSSSRAPGRKPPTRRRR